METHGWCGGLLAGVDEVGRGPLAGDVVAAAVILDPRRPISGLADSKMLGARRRDELYAEVVSKALCWQVGRASVAEIDHLNILQASLLAMSRAVDGLSMLPEMVLVDGNRLPQWRYQARALVRGDALIPAISAASIVAKVTRDREMIRLDAHFPGYGFAANKGYGTRLHLAALDALGPCEWHRRSFAPVRVRHRDQFGAGCNAVDAVDGASPTPGFSTPEFSG